MPELSAQTAAFAYAMHSQHGSSPLIQAAPANLTPSKGVST